MAAIVKLTSSHDALLTLNDFTELLFNISLISDDRGDDYFIDQISNVVKDLRKSDAVIIVKSIMKFIHLICNAHFEGMKEFLKENPFETETFVKNKIIPSC